MKKLLIFSFMVLTAFCLFSCRENDCTVPPEIIVFEFVNTEGENLLENGSLQPQDIEVFEKEADGSTRRIKTLAREDHKLAMEGIGWVNGIRDYEVFLHYETGKSFKFRVTSSAVTGKCNGFRIDKTEIQEVTYQHDEGFYRIFLD